MNILKNKFLKSTIFVILLGLIAKLLSMIVKIYTTRTYGIEFMSIYSIVNPLMMFIIVMVQFSLPYSISKLVAKNKEKRKDVLLSAYVISLSISLLVMTILIIFSKELAILLFKNIETKHSIMAIGVYAPLVTLTSIYKGYLIGNNKVEITSFSQIFEEIARLFFIYLTSSYFINKNISYGSMGIIVGMWIGEVFQMISLILLNYKNKFNIKIINKNLFNTKTTSYKELLSISLPITLSRLITSFTFSLEPIIYTNISLRNNLTIDEITSNYGILQTYVNPILFLPSFFISSISIILLPNLTRLFHERKIDKSKELFIKSLLLSILIGLISSIFIFFFSKEISSLLFKNNIGVKYIKVLAFPYILYYIESILNTTLHSIDKEKIALKISIVASIIRVILLYILIPIFGFIGIEISMLISVLFIILINSFFIRKHLFLNI